MNFTRRAGMYMIQWASPWSQATLISLRLYDHTRQNFHICDQSMSERLPVYHHCSFRLHASIKLNLPTTVNISRDVARPQTRKKLIRNESRNKQVKITVEAMAGQQQRAFLHQKNRLRRRGRTIWKARVQENAEKHFRRKVQTSFVN